MREEGRREEGRAMKESALKIFRIARIVEFAVLHFSSSNQQWQKTFVPAGGGEQIRQHPGRRSTRWQERRKYET